MVPIIFLNGAAAAGKTTLGTALQAILDKPYLLLGLDTCFHAVPDRWGSQGPERHQGFAYHAFPPEDGHPVLGIVYGDIGWRILASWHQALAALVQAGTAVIIDELLLDARVRDHWLAVLQPFDRLLVGVQCELAELERRERTRTPPRGLARWSARQVHTGMPYDLIVDTTATAPATCAQQILDHLISSKRRP